MENLMSHQHGGDLDAITRKYHISRKEIVDFSGNINPLGFPDTVKQDLAAHLDLVSTYPDKDYTSLKRAIGQYTKANPEYIVVGNGSTELISTFIKTIHANHTLILGPAYSEYEKAAGLCGSPFHYFPLKEEENFQLNINSLLETLTPEIGLLIICNPNNPTGTAIFHSQLEKILSHCQKNHTAVMIDETYIEFSDNLEEICAIEFVEKYPELFITRGISKFFAAPGLRLGYALSSNPDFLKNLKTHQDPWSVNILAAYAGERLFTQQDFMKKTKELISSQRKFILEELSHWKNLKVYPSNSNFILTKLLTKKINAAEIFEALIAKKLLIRDAASFTFLDESFLRFCILQPHQNKFLLNQLKELIESY